MRKIDFGFRGTCNHEVTYFPDSTQVKRTDLRGNDTLMLWGALALAAKHWEEDGQLELLDLDVARVIDEAAISDDSLYLGNFEGYPLYNGSYWNDEPRYVLKNIELNANNCVIWSILDRKNDRFIECVD